MRLFDGPYEGVGRACQTRRGNGDEIGWVPPDGEICIEWSFAEIREPCDAAMCGKHGKPEGSRLFSSPSLRGCTCRCAEGFGGQFCEVP